MEYCRHSTAPILHQPGALSILDPRVYRGHPCPQNRAGQGCPGYVFPVNLTLSEHEFLLVHLLIETDHEAIADLERRSSQVAARPHDSFENGRRLLILRYKFLNFFAFCDHNPCRGLQTPPGGAGVNAFFTRVGNL